MGVWNERNLHRSSLFSMSLDAFVYCISHDSEAAAAVAAVAAEVGSSKDAGHSEDAADYAAAEAEQEYRVERLE